MKLIIHRGSGQIGGNVVEVSTQNTKIILDCGKNLPPLDGTPAKDSFSLEGLTFGKSTCDAVFITHYHADHCGLLERINPDIPIYMERRTQGVLEVIADFIDGPVPRADHILQPGQAVTVGDIRVLPLNVRHSACGALMFLVEAQGRRLLYTGDFNHIDDSVLAHLENVDVMLCEGTNIDRPCGPTELSLEQRAAQIMSRTSGHVFVLCSAANIDRIRSIEHACRLSGRTLAFDPFAKAIFERTGYTVTGGSAGFVPHYIDAQKTPRAHRHLIREDSNWFEGRTFSSTDAVAKMNGLTFLVRQTMGSFLQRLDRLSPIAGSTFVYSMWRGYEETAPTKAFLNLCRSLGIKVEYLHASGHACRDTLQKVIQKTKPSRLVPVHTQNADAFSGLHDNIVPLKDKEVMEV